MSTYTPGFHKNTQISLQTRRQFHVAAMRVMLTKAQQAIKNNDDYFLPENFQKFTVHLYSLFFPNIEVNDLTESFTEILDKLAAQDVCTKTPNSEHDMSNSEVPSEFEIEYSTLQSDITFSRNAHPLFLQNSEPTLPNFLQKNKGKSEKSAKHKKNYYSTIKKYDQHTKNYSDTESDEFLSLSEDDDDKNTDYVTTLCKIESKKVNGNLLPKLQKPLKFLTFRLSLLKI